MSISHEAFTLLIIENYLCKDDSGAWMFPAPVHQLKFTARKSVGKDGSYSEESIAHYNALQTLVRDGRQYLKLKYPVTSDNDQLANRPDKIILPGLNLKAIAVAASDGITDSDVMPNEILVFAEEYDTAETTVSPQQDTADAIEMGDEEEDEGITMSNEIVHESL